MNIVKIKKGVCNMFLEKYLSPVYLDIVYNNYDNEYLKLLDEDNFNEVYNFLKDMDFILLMILLLIILSYLI